MTTQTQTLADFLLERYDEDKREFEVYREQWVNGGGVTRSGSRGWERMLAECAAKRQIVEQVSNVEWCGHAVRDVILGLLAQPYADAPGFREEWR